MPRRRHLTPVPWDDDERIYRKHAEELIRFATFLVGPSEAPDVVIDAVLRAFASPAWPGVTQPRAYLFRSVLNEARCRQRSDSRRHRREQRAFLEQSPPEVETPELLLLLDSLSPRQRAVVYLTYWDDLTPGSIAELLGISDGAVHRHLARARAALRRMLHDD